METPLLSIIVPCFNEEDMLPIFFKEVIPQIEAATEGRWEIICVDDGSRDQTLAVITDANIADARVKGVRLSRNFGHQAALSAGLAFAQGDFIGFMDCDLQDPVHILIEMFRMCQNNEYDVCYGIRGKRHGPIWLKIGYKLFYFLMNRFASHNWPIDTGDFSVINKRCQRILLSMPERSRMLRGLRSWVGFKQSGIRYVRPARRQGKSKYNVIRLLALAMQGFVGFSSVPLRLATFMGFLMSGLIILFGLAVIINRIFPGFTLFNYWVGVSPVAATILVFLSVVSSGLFLALGIIGEYLNVLLEEVKRRPTSVIDTVVGNLEFQKIDYPVVR